MEMKTRLKGFPGAGASVHQSQWMVFFDAGDAPGQSGGPRPGHSIFSLVTNLHCNDLLFITIT